MAVNLSKTVEIINRNKDKKRIATRILETQPILLSTIPKLINDKNQSLASGIDNDRLEVNRQLLESIHSKVMSVTKNNENIIKLFPDVELGIQILVSSILSPKKMTDIQLNYKLADGVSLSSAVSAKLLEEIKTYINSEYEFEDDLPDIVREALFESGAAVYMVVPEAGVDQVINADLLVNYSTEEFKARTDSLFSSYVSPRNLPIIQSQNFIPLDKTPRGLVKHLASEEYVKLTDNSNIIKYSKVVENIRSAMIRRSSRSGVSISAESADKLGYMGIFRARGAADINKTVEILKRKNETTRKSLGKPMVVKIPTAAVIPLITGSGKKDHAAYLILLDGEGRPLSDEVRNTNLNQMFVNIQNGDKEQLNPAQKAFNELIYDSTSNVNINDLFDMYKPILEKQLFDTVRSSLYGGNLTPIERNDVYYMMFTRALSGQKTNVLFVPKELIVYYAFQYNDLGIGKTLLENMSILSSLRAITLFSKVMAYAKQSIDVTKVNISLDPNDPDPEKTIEQVQDAALKLRQNFLPLGINNPPDLVNWITRAGLQFAYDNHPGLPNVKIDFENANLSHTVPDSTLEEELRKQMILSMGLSPETVDNGFSPEFATTIVNNNVLMSKRISIYQKTLMRAVKQYIGMIVYNDEDLRDKLSEIIQGELSTITESLSEEQKTLLNKDKELFINNYIDYISEQLDISLPKPEDTNITTLSIEYEQYSVNLDKVLDSVISAEIFSEDISGQISTHIDTIRNIYKHHLLREWMATNNYYPEVLEISSDDKVVADKLLVMLKEYLVTTGRNSAKLFKLTQVFKEALNKDMENVTGDSGEASTTDSSSSTTEESEESNSDGLLDDSTDDMGF